MVRAGRTRLPPPLPARPVTSIVAELIGVPPRDRQPGDDVVSRMILHSQDSERPLVVLLDPEPPASEHENVRLAVQRCPAAMITLV